MKKIIPLCFLLMLSAGRLWSQSFPDGMSYQAVARDVRGQVLADQPIRLWVQFKDGGLEGAVLFSEKHESVTTEQGVFSIVIGQGADRSGALTEIGWMDKEMWLVISLEDSGELIPVHFLPLLALPYSFHSQSAARLSPTEKAAGPIGFWQVCGNDNVDSTEVKDRYFLGTTAVHPELRHNLNFRVGDHNDPYPMLITADGLVKIDKLNGEDGNRLPNIKVRANPERFAQGEDDQIGAYPVQVRGGKQGVAIRLHGADAGKTTSANNFMTFWDHTGQVLGAIEGQTLDELKNSKEYDWELTSASFKITQPGLEMGANIIQTIQAVLTAIFYPSAAKDTEFAEIAVNATGTYVNGKNLQLYLESLEQNLGVAYQSGGADYAEWLERADPEEHFLAGEVVGVKAGKISRITADAERLLVISHSPAVLGNQPPVAKAASFEKVAFLGQVWTQVAGVVRLGDYILPSGRNDGLGKAVHPEEMTAQDYGRLIGVAWSEAPAGALNLVKVAVGLEVNPLAQALVRQQARRVALEEKLEQVLAYLADKDPAFQYTLSGGRMTTNPDVLSRWLDENEGLIQTQLEWMRNYYEERGVDWTPYPEVRALLNDPVPALKNILSGRYLNNLDLKNEKR